MNFIQHAKQVLRENNFKLTGPRLKIVELFNNLKEPVNAYDLAKKMAGKGSKVDTVTIYRVLALLEKLSLLHKVAGAYTVCQDFNCRNKKHCHHQFLCSSCRSVTEIHLEDDGFLSIVKKRFPKLNINSHHFEFSGTCDKCST